jgi:hypothetical protein
MIHKLCALLRPSYSDVLDGAPIAPVRGFFVKMHLAVCPTCIRYNRSLKATRDALRALRDAPIEDDDLIEKTGHQT